MTSKNKDMANSKIESTSIEAIGFKDLDIEKLEAADQDHVGLAMCIRSLRQNWRQGTVACKDRGEVAFSNKKPWKQKGTGRARAGSLRSPVWRKGGVIFGPQERTRILKVSKKQNNKILVAILNDFITNNKIFSLNFDIKGDSPKTKLAHQALMAANLHNKKINLFVGFDDFMSQASFSNISNVNLMLFDQANAYDLLNAQAWVFLKKDFDAFNEMVKKWL